MQLDRDAQGRAAQERAEDGAGVENREASAGTGLAIDCRCPICGAEIQGTVRAFVDVSPQSLTVDCYDPEGARWYCENDHELPQSLVDELDWALCGLFNSGHWTLGDAPWDAPGSPLAGEAGVSEAPTHGVPDSEPTRTGKEG